MKIKSLVLFLPLLLVGTSYAGTIVVLPSVQAPAISPISLWLFAVGIALSLFNIVGIYAYGAVGRWFSPIAHFVFGMALSAMAAIMLAFAGFYRAEIIIPMHTITNATNTITILNTTLTSIPLTANSIFLLIIESFILINVFSAIAYVLLLFMGRRNRPR
jgi:hypothetical protein